MLSGHGADPSREAAKPAVLISVIRKESNLEAGGLFRDCPALEETQTSFHGPLRLPQTRMDLNGRQKGTHPQGRICFAWSCPSRQTRKGAVTTDRQ